MSYIDLALSFSLGRPSSSWVIWCFKELWRAKSVLPRDWDMGYGIKALSLMISIFISAVLSNFLGVKDLVSCRIWAVFICHGFWIPKSECSKPEYNIWFNTSESGVQILNSFYIAWFGDHILWSECTGCCYGKLFGRMIFRCASISWIQVVTVSRWVIYVFQLAHLRVF